VTAAPAPTAVVTLHETYVSPPNPGEELDSLATWRGGHGPGRGAGGQQGQEGDRKQGAERRGGRSAHRPEYRRWRRGGTVAERRIASFA